jgi:hypothetical protein
LRLAFERAVCAEDRHEPIHHKAGIGLFVFVEFFDSESRLKLAVLIVNDLYRYVERPKLAEPGCSRWGHGAWETTHAVP